MTSQEPDQIRVVCVAPDTEPLPEWFVPGFDVDGRYPVPDEDCPAKHPDGWECSLKAGHPPMEPERPHYDGDGYEGHVW